MLDSCPSPPLSTLPTTSVPSCAGLDNGNNVDWSNSIDLQILTNIQSSVPSLALNNTHSHHPPSLSHYRKQQNRFRLINLRLRFSQSSVQRYAHYRGDYSLYYLSLGNLSSPEGWPQVQSKQLNEHETSNFLASPSPSTPGQPQFCPLTFCPAHSTIPRLYPISSAWQLRLILGLVEHFWLISCFMVNVF